MNFNNETIIGKVPPQNVNMEKAIISAIMIGGSDALSEIINIVTPDSFYIESHKIIFKSFLDLYEENKPLDIGLVAHKISEYKKIDEIGGLQYLMEVSNMVASSANIEYHALIVAQKYIQRQCIDIFSKGVDNAFDDSLDIFEIINEIENKLEVTYKNTTTEPVQASSLVKQVLSNISKAKELAESGYIGTDTGFNDLNKTIGGWVEDSLYIIAGRPGMGKTALALSSIINNDRDNFLIFSLEMSKVQITNRLISMVTNIPLQCIQKGYIDENDIVTITNRADRLKRILIDDDPELNIRQIKGKIKKFKENGGQVVIIDYLQLIQLSQDEAKGKNREQQIGYISRKLKIYSKLFHIPIIAIAQLSRSSEQRPDKKPLLSDLRESGSIEMDADCVIFPYRAEYYDKNATNADGVSLQGMAEIIIAKNRDGSTDSIYTQFDGSRTLFLPLN